MPVKDYRKDLLVRLSDPAYSAQYLKAALDETLKDGDRDAFLLALKNIVEATAAVQDFSNNSDISRQHLQQILSGSENLTLETLASALNTVGLTI